MATFRTFTDIDAWQKARVLASELYDISNRSSFGRDFALRDQIRRAAVSVMSNIAEGFERNGTSEFIHFLSMAKGSTGEIIAQLYIAKDQQYISQEEFDHLSALAAESGKLIGALMNYLRKTTFKGAKFRGL